mmetsp:Transcript_16263/g.54697  ORF Transcript_16263/g.54697 Transcript_16263/m.54697 type:complete len:288 (+) Transcript_16263:112-975(+)
MQRAAYGRAPGVRGRPHPCWIPGPPSAAAASARPAGRPPPGVFNFRTPFAHDRAPGLRSADRETGPRAQPPASQPFTRHEAPRKPAPRARGHGRGLRGGRPVRAPGRGELPLQGGHGPGRPRVWRRHRPRGPKVLAGGAPREHGLRLRRHGLGLRLRHAPALLLGLLLLGRLEAQRPPGLHLGGLHGHAGDAAAAHQGPHLAHGVRHRGHPRAALHREEGDLRLGALRAVLQLRRPHPRPHGPLVLRQPRLAHPRGHGAQGVHQGVHRPGALESDFRDHVLRVHGCH